MDILVSMIAEKMTPAEAARIFVREYGARIVERAGCFAIEMPVMGIRHDRRFMAATLALGMDRMDVVERNGGHMVASGEFQHR